MIFTRQATTVDDLAALRAELERLRKDNDKLRARNKKLLQRLKFMHQCVWLVIGLLCTIIHEAEKKMHQGDLPRAAFAYVKGEHHAAAEVLEYIRRPGPGFWGGVPD